jgi:outer membrane protein TolC
VGTAKKATNLATLSADDRSRTILAAVADAIIAVVTAERVAEVNRVGLKSSLQTLELTERKMRLGSGTKLDVVRAQQDVAVARATLINGDEAVRKSREALGLALGFHDDWSIAQAVNLDMLGDSVRQICSPAKPEERQDVLAAKANLEVSERGVKGSYLAYAPTVQASTTLQGANTQLASGHDYAWSIQGLLTWNIFDGGVRYGTTRIAKADVVEKKATLDVAIRTANQQVIQANRGVTVADASKAVAQESRDLAKETARLSQVAFEAGTGTSFDLVTSQSLARQAELTLANAEFSVIQAKLTALLAASSCKY